MTTFPREPTTPDLHDQAEAHQLDALAESLDALVGTFLPDEPDSPPTVNSYTAAAPS
ncbi:hypothetical protein AB0C52_32050 [Streptomyces sp. NPDC048717]|uniref:hypothetical protein n=1 Tax=Streptomyces sp. NPDC048717 TaxID=3154928 RepID=UPI0034438551